MGALCHHSDQSLALKDAEARRRALIREVGTLREDLRRECKRRERAVAQNQELEDARQEATHHANELEYRCRKLSQQLESVQAAARIASERDRSALRSLREGLSAVEDAVTERAHKGYQQVQGVFEYLHKLRALLFMPTQLGAPLHPIAQSIAPDAGSLLSDAVRGLAQLAELLMGSAAASASAAAAASPAADVSDAAGTGDSAADDDGDVGAAHDAPHGAVQGAAVIFRAGGGSGGGDEHAALERSSLLDELVRLRAELRVALERNESSATATALELQQALSKSRGEVVTLRSEVLRLQAELQRGGLECDSLQQQIRELQLRVAQKDASAAGLLALAEEQGSASLSEIAELQAERVALESASQRQRQQLSALQDALEDMHRENALLVEHLSARDAEATEAETAAARHAGRAAELQAVINAQHDDICSAMALVTAPTIARHMPQSPYLPAARPASADAVGACSRIAAARLGRSSESAAAAAAAAIAARLSRQQHAGRNGEGGLASQLQPAAYTVWPSRSWRNMTREADKGSTAEMHSGDGSPATEASVWARPVHHPAANSRHGHPLTSQSTAQGVHPQPHRDAPAGLGTTLRERGGGTGGISSGGCTAEYHPAATALPPGTQHWLQQHPVAAGGAGSPTPAWPPLTAVQRQYSGMAVGPLGSHPSRALSAGHRRLGIDQRATGLFAGDAAAGRMAPPDAAAATMPLSGSMGVAPRPAAGTQQSQGWDAGLRVPFAAHSPSRSARPDQGYGTRVVRATSGARQYGLGGAAAPADVAEVPATAPTARGRIAGKAGQLARGPAQGGDEQDILHLRRQMASLDQEMAQLDAQLKASTAQK